MSARSQEPTEAPDAPGRGVTPVLVVAGVLLILLCAVLQGLGFCRVLERGLLRQLPSSLTPKAPRVAMLELEKDNGGEFAEMDAALALRGLEQLHPRSVTILGTVKREEGSMDFLPAMLTRFRETKGHFPVMIPVPPSSDARYAPLPWLDVNPPPSWTTLAGKSDNGSDGSFLTDADQGTGIPLFGKTETGSAGSLWWRTLLETLPAVSQARLLFDQILLSGNQAPLRLTASGRFDAAGAPCPRAPLDEFLLRMEQREQGSNSPGFDGIWADAVVVIGTADDLPKAMVFQSLLEQASLSRLAPALQALVALLCILPLIALKGGSFMLRMTAALLIVITAGTITFLLIRHGLLFPWIPAAVSALLLLLIPSPRGGRESV